MTTVDRKQEILEAAQDLLQTQGYTGFSYQDLSDRLGIAKPSIHHHFPTKEALGLALIESYVTMLGFMQGQVAQAGSSPRAQFEAFLAFGEAERSAHERGICPAGALHANYETFPPAMQTATRELSEAMHTWLSDLFERGRELGEFQFQGSAEDAAWSCMSTLQGARQQARTHGDDLLQRVSAQVKANLFT